MLPTQSGPGRKVRLAVLAFGLTITATLLLLEIGLRLAAAAGTRAGDELRRRDPMAVQVEPLGELGYRQRPGSVYRYPNGTAARANALGYRGPVVEIPKPPGVFRIVLLGGSTTHGWGVDDGGTIDAAMRRILAAERPDLRTEVVNLGFDGYDSYRLFERLHHDGLRLAPDLVIVHEGINDVRNARIPNLRDRDPRALIWESEVRRARQERARGGPTWSIRLRHWFYVMRLPSYVMSLANTSEDRRRARKAVPTMDAADDFERNMKRIAHLAQANGFPVLFSAAPSSLRVKYQPGTMVRRTYFVVDNATTQAYRDSLAARMRSLASRLAAEGRHVGYVSIGAVPREEFLDDAHLTPSGNARVAADFVAAVLPFLPSRRPEPGRGR
jgi:lysophospholipase L1-like esterase